MKSFLKSNTFLLVATLVMLISCSKEIQTPIPVNTATKSMAISNLPKPKMENGMLCFNTRQEFIDAVKFLNSQASDYILKWNKDLSFVSQESIYQKIIKAENNCRDAQIALLNPNLTDKELNKIEVNHSEIYDQYLVKKFIIEVTEKDGCKYFKHNTLNPTYMCVLNGEGFVRVNDTIYQYLPNQVKYISDGDFNKIKRLKDLASTSVEENIFVIEFNNRLKLVGGNWSKSTFKDGEVWIYDGSIRRVRVDVVAQCPSSSQPETAALVSYYIEVTSQKKLLFWWDIRNNYMPIRVVQGSWTWYENYVEENNWLHNWSDQYAGNLYYNFPSGGGYSNYCKFYLEPDGWVGFWTGYLLDNFSIDYSFSVTADGYSSSDLSLSN